MVSGENSWLESEETDQISITVNTSGLQIDTLYRGNVLVLTNNSYISLGINLNTGNELSTIATQLPNEFRLYPAYPNPFNPVTKISFYIPAQNQTKVVVYDLIGKEVAVLLNTKLNDGDHIIFWDAGNISTGLYFIRLQSGSFIRHEKVLLLK